MTTIQHLKVFKLIKTVFIIVGNSLRVTLMHNITVISNINLND